MLTDDELWDDIENAPHDEGYLWVKLPDGRETRAVWVEGKGWHCRTANDNYFMLCYPTHWRPIPRQLGHGA